ncbi:MAG TPA: DUF2064 domain-containing protein [Thermoanaerobaculia bacterium]|nr:DUF2064 domain-containing protein [Thermoanaerobaculia bacterium]
MPDLPCLLLFTKPARAGRVKTRLIGAEVGGRRLDAADAAALHAASLGDLAERLALGAGHAFRLRVAWDLAPGEPLPAPPPELAGRPGVDAVRQRGCGLGERLFAALADAAREHPLVAAVGSDHPTLPLATVERSFAALAEGDGDVALGPSHDGGYYLIALAPRALSPRLFAEIDWSSEWVRGQTLERCSELGLRVVELPPGRDIDRGDDVAALAADIAAAEAVGGAGEAPDCPRARALLARWGLLPGAVSSLHGEAKKRSSAVSGTSAPTAGAPLVPPP